MILNRLTALQIQRARPRDSDYRLYDGGGISLLVKKSGARWWRFAYTFETRKEISLGVYPNVSLADARNKRDEYRTLIADGINPSRHRKAASQSTADPDSFEVIAREWLVGYRESISDEHANNILARMEKDLFPWLGKNSVREVSALDIKACLDRVRDRGAIETARRVRVISSQVFVYAISTGRCIVNPAASLTGYLPAISKTRKHFAAVTDPRELPALLRDMHGYVGRFETRCALQLLPMLLLRPGELRSLRWEYLDRNRGELLIPANAMKMKMDHLVPLPGQAMEILVDLMPATSGKSLYCFPSMRSTSRCMSDNTINAAFRRMGIDKETVCGHGFRATARTILDEVLGFRPDIIDHQLAHMVKDPNGRAYNRTTHLEQRREMLQVWADYLDKLREQA